jgi:hypothetical protein
MTIQRIRTGLAAALLLSLSALASAPAPAPTKIKPGFNLFSVEQDIEIGRQSAAEVDRQLPILQDPAVESHVNAIGTRLAGFIPGFVPGKRFPYQFKVVNASDINAFALPGGFLYLNRGLIEAAKSEGQLAGVMAHEMAHVALRHGTNQASEAYLAQTSIGLLGGLFSKDDGTTDKVMGAVGGFGLNALFLKFSRTDEEQADIVGAQTMARSGYDPQDMVDFFELLQATQSREPGKVEQFFSSHPAPADRATRIRNEMKLLRIGKADTIGGFKQAKAALIAMPPARSMQEITQNQPAAIAVPRPVSNGKVSDIQIQAPSAEFQTLDQGKRLFRIDYPSNWRVYESAQGLGVTIAPEGGLVDSGGYQNDLIYGVVLNHYAPFRNDVDDARFSFQGAPGTASSLSVSRTSLALAMNDLVGQIVRTNPTLKMVPNSQRVDMLDGASALSLVLSGRSAATGDDERVTVFTRELPDDHIVYALFIAPGQDYGQLHGTFTRMMGSLRVNDDAKHP